MPQPKLIHPLNIVIKPLDTSTTIYDANAREAIQIVKRKVTITIAGQVEYRDFTQHAQSDARYEKQGFVGEERGYILIRYIDAAQLGYVPAIGDEITMIGLDTLTPQSTIAFVHRLKPCMHYPRFGKTAVKLYFADRKPAING